MSTREVPADLRQKAGELAKRLQTDESFRSQVEADPRGTLTAAGLPDKAVEDFLNENSEVTGYKPCDDATCWWTCLSTCAVTG